jgi:hypothetical protein
VLSILVVASRMTPVKFVGEGGVGGVTMMLTLGVVHMRQVLIDWGRTCSGRKEIVKAPWGKMPRMKMGSSTES